MTNSSGFRYDPGDFPPCAVTVDIVVFTIADGALRVLVIERGGEPYLGAFALPGGFVREDEDLMEAAERELAEETGLVPRDWHLEQLGSYGAPGRDPRMRVVTVAHWAVCADLPALQSGGDAVQAKLVPVKHIESGRLRLAFDHGRIVADAVARVRQELENTPLAVKFCPPQFTIAELRRVFETVWETGIDPGNFQRSVRRSGFLRMSAPPDSRRSEGRGRPPALWSMDNDWQETVASPYPLHRRRKRPEPEREPDGGSEESEGNEGSD